MPLQVKNIADLYSEAARVYGDRAAFATREKKGKHWRPITYKELYERGLELATALIDLGVKPRDHVGLLADNRMEWIIADYGVQLCGAADVPRGADVTPDEILYILDHCGAKVTFVENLLVYEKLKKVQKQLKQLKHIILMDPDEKAPAGVHTLQELLEKGRKLREKGNRKAEEHMAGIKDDDLFTLIYTSGTTGTPKGVMLTHANIISQLYRIPIKITPLDRVLSILPIWHIFERVIEMYSIFNGCCTYYTNVRNLGDDLKAVRPTFMGSAPRLWESIHAKIMANVEKAHPVRRFLFHAAYFFSRMYKSSLFFLKGKRIDLEGRNPLVSFFLGIFHAIRWFLVIPLYGLFNASVLERLRQAAGGDLKASLSGGGALPPHIDEFFNYIGIPVLEGYGMTETSPVISCRTFDDLVIGTVGKVIKDTEIRLVDPNTGEIIFPNPKYKGQGRGRRGEIHVKGPQVMKGYYKNPEATKKVLHDGWLNTGDLGIMTFNNCLKIVGRTKDTVVLISGENVEPVPIEARLLESPLIDNVMVVGQDKKYLTALIVPSVEGFKEQGIHGDVASLSKNEKVKSMIADVISKTISADAGFKNFERIVDFRLVPKPFEVGDELTNLYKLKRHVITEKYKKLIEEMYRS
ncbi:MAG: long-chain fatty acid--CoA ligase [Leptospiraceae bacterium]|nr:long-chain fatty acid--CoA ligase [Leptospiraceae bacterium]